MDPEGVALSGFAEKTLPCCMKRVLLLLLLLSAKQMLACSCVVTPLESRIASADFAALARIVQVSPDTENENQHDLRIEIISLYKGEKVSSLKLRSMLNTSCAFYTPENTTWLLFANRNADGDLSFGFCSGAMQLDREFPDNVHLENGITAEELESNYRQTYERKLEVLEYMRDKGIEPENEFGVRVRFPAECLENLKGRKSNTRFALYRVRVNPDLSVDRVSAVKKFDNPKITQALRRCFKKGLEVLPANRKEGKKIPRKTEVFMILYQVPSEEGEDAFVSRSIF